MHSAILPYTTWSDFARVGLGLQHNIARWCSCVTVLMEQQLEDGYK